MVRRPIPVVYFRMALESSTNTPISNRCCRQRLVEAIGPRCRVPDKNHRQSGRRTDTEPLEGRHSVLFGEEKKHIEITRRVTKQTQHHRNLPAMMDSMRGSMLHEFTQRHRTFLTRIIEIFGVA